MIKATDLSKNFGKLKALDKVSVHVREGDIYGLIGPNGAGKSTLFKILATILRPGAGKATIAGIPVQKGQAVRSVIGYMPDVFGVYEDLTVSEYLEFFAAAYDIPAKKRRRLVKDVLALTDLTFKRAAMVKSLSRGMQQRLGVARVLVHDPKVLILDEPASGLDPRARIELRELIRELARLGKTILISSHILVELSEICNRIGIIETGRILFEGSREELQERLSSHGEIVLELEGPLEDTLVYIQSRVDVSKAWIDGCRIRVQRNEEAGPMSALLADLVGQGASVRRFDPEEVSLEDAFMILTKGRLA